MPTSDDTPSVEEMVERLLATDDLPDELHGTRRRTQEYGGGLKETRFEIWERPPIEFRQEILSAETVREFEFVLVNAPSGRLDGEVDVVIQNESGMVGYASDANQYHKHDFEPPEDAGGYINDLTMVGSSPETNFEVTYDGTDAVAGRETHVLTFRPTEDADFPRRELVYVTMWVDGEYWVPLRREVVHDIREEGLLQPDRDEDLQDETYFQTMTFEEIAFDIGIKDSRFYPPEDAERVE